MMKRANFKGIYARTREMLFHPDTEWQAVKREDIAGAEVFRGYLVPLTLTSSACTLVLQLLHTPPLYALLTAAITFATSVGGAYLTYRITREDLTDKIAEANNVALRLSVDCSAIFIVFHCLSEGMPDGFFSQLLGLLSLLCLRTLYIGINQMSRLNVQLRKSTLIIAGLLLVVSPMIIQRLLMLLFRVPTITLNI